MFGKEKEAELFIQSMLINAVLPFFFFIKKWPKITLLSGLNTS